MSELTIDFVKRLVSQFSGLQPVFDEHVSDNFGEVLPHVFFGDLTRYVVSRSLEAGPKAGPNARRAEQEVRELLDALEEAYASGDEEIQELIAVSFLENLPRPGEEGSKVRSELGPRLTQQLRLIG